MTSSPSAEGPRGRKPTKQEAAIAILSATAAGAVIAGLAISLLGSDRDTTKAGTVTPACIQNFQQQEASLASRIRNNLHFSLRVLTERDSDPADIDQLTVYYRDKDSSSYTPKLGAPIVLHCASFRRLVGIHPEAIHHPTVGPLFETLEADDPRVATFVPAPDGTGGVIAKPGQTEEAVIALRAPTEAEIQAGFSLQAAGDHSRRHDFASTIY